MMLDLSIRPALRRFACAAAVVAALAPWLGAPAAAQAAVPTPATVATHYAARVQANCEDTRQAARAMQQAIAAFTAQPSAATQAAARQAWLAAREFYGQTEAFRFYGGPIDDDRGPRAASTPGRWRSPTSTPSKASRAPG